MMKPSVAGVILCGGLNSRMGGCNKAFIKLAGARLLDRPVDTLSTRFSEILLVARDPGIKNPWGIRIVNDIIEIRSPLSGIHAGLMNMSADYAFCTGCDAPFLERRVIDILVEEIEPGVDVIVPFSDTYYQPLCAIYSRRCAGIIEEQLSRGDLKVDNLYDSVSLKKIPYEKIQQVDQNLISFFNVNTVEDLQGAEQILNGSIL